MEYQNEIEKIDTTIPQDYYSILYSIVDYYFILELTAFNLFCSLTMGIIGYLLVGISIWMAYFTFLTASIIFNIIHRLQHTNLIWALYNAHTLGHHVKAYPSKMFLTTDYVIDQKSADITNQLFICLSPIFILSLKILLMYNWLQVLMLTSYVGIIAWSENEIHKQIHLQQSKLNKYEWFQKLRFLHYLHHRGDCKRNFNLREFIIDLTTGGLMLNT